jgi:hypothetical protein
LTHQELAGERAADAEPADRRGFRHRAVHFRGRDAVDHDGGFIV